MGLVSIRTIATAMCGALVVACGSSEPVGAGEAIDGGSSSTGSGGVSGATESDASGVGVGGNATSPEAGVGSEGGKLAADGPSDGLPPDFGMGESNTGPGGPTKTFTADQLFKNCAFLDGGDEDIVDHHNLVTMYDGYLLLPWAPEFGRGGLSFFDISDPCSPKRVGHGFSAEMRETHTIPISNIGGKKWVVMDMMREDMTPPRKGGIQFWDISDITAPKTVSALEVPDYVFPSAYQRVINGSVWQGRYVFSAGAENGVYVIDVADPTKPVVKKQFNVSPVLPLFSIVAVGNLLFVHGAEQSRTILFDISDPLNPQPIAGGDFSINDGTGTKNAYGSSLSGGFAFYARQSGAGGLIIYDLRQPTMPKLSGQYATTTAGVNGGYVFVQEPYAFVGNSSTGNVYDITDHKNIMPLGTFALTGDFDTVTPIGNVAFLSVDENPTKDQATAVAPWSVAPDTTPPRVTWSYPADGSKNLRLSSRIGVTLSEFVDIKSAWKAGHVILYKTSAGQAARVPGMVNAAENVINFSPDAPLEPNTNYTLEIPAGGIEDFNGNKLKTGFKMTLTTGAD